MGGVPRVLLAFVSSYRAFYYKKQTRKLYEKLYQQHFQKFPPPKKKKKKKMRFLSKKNVISFYQKFSFALTVFLSTLSIVL